MHKFTLVLKHEIITTLRRRSFLYTAFGLPLIAVLIFAISVVFKSDSFRSIGDRIEIPQALENKKQPNKSQGFVDYSGLIHTIPESIPETALRSFPDQIAAKQAVEAGQILGFYIIPKDYIQTGEIIYIQSKFNLNRNASMYG